MVAPALPTFSSWPPLAPLLPVIYGFLYSPPLLALLLSIIFLVLVLRKSGKPPVYIVDYCCARPPDETKTNLEMLFYLLKRLGTVSDRDIYFQSKVFLKSGIGEEAHVPRANLVKGILLSMEDSYNQAHLLVVGAVDTVLKKRGVSPKQVDILVVNCGLFNPTPSLAAMLVNALNMREDVKTYHLAGMGCSAGLIALGLAKDLLQVNRERAHYAIVASSEVIQQLYAGKERPMMVTNCLFRSAGNAVLLSNRREDKARSKMQVSHVVRTNTARYDEAHNVVVFREDDEGHRGACLKPQLVKIAGDSFTNNVESLAPRVLPITELCKAGWNLLQKRIWKKGVVSYVPNFKLAFQHFCIHPGGRAVVEGVGKGLSLDPHDMEPSLMALHRFGNTSCSGVWYILAYMEAKRRLKKGDRIWQIGLGSGFKCASAVLLVLDNDLHCEYDNPWYDCVHRYPLVEDLMNQPHIADLVNQLPKWLDLPARK